LLNASVGVQRVVGRLRRPPSSRASSATTVAVRLAAALHLQRRFRAVVAASNLAPRHNRIARGIVATHPTHATHATRQARLSLIARIGHDRSVALAAVAIVLGASVVSVSASRPVPATGGPTGPGAEVRIAVGGEVGVAGAGTITDAEPLPDLRTLGRKGEIDTPLAASKVAPAAGVDGTTEAQPELAAAAPAGVEGPFLDDGTLLKPVAVNTTVADGSALMETYKVKSGDTLTGIASKFGVSMMTVWWANNLKSKDDLHLGQVLTIPPVTGLVLTVKSSDTLASLAGRYKVDEKEILEANKLADPNLVVGQVLAIPGAIG